MHVLFALKHDKGITSVRLLLLSGLLMRMGILDDSNLEIVSCGALTGGTVKTNTLNGPESSKVPLEVALIGLVAEAGDHHGRQRIATDVGVFLWFD